MNEFSTTSGLSLPSHPERSLTQIRCPKCGKWAIVDASMVLTSYPPQYGCHCHDCGNVFYIFCSELGRRTDVRTYDEDGTIRENLKVGPNDTTIGIYNPLTNPLNISGGSTTAVPGTEGKRAINIIATDTPADDITVSTPFTHTVELIKITTEDKKVSLHIFDADGFLVQFDKINISGVEFERKK